MAAVLISRQEAIRQGLKRYFTGQPCKRGHISERQVSNLTCMTCAAEKCRDRYDPERNRINGKRWREANRDKVRLDKRAYGLTAKNKAYKAAWYAANRDRMAKKKQAWYAANRENAVAYTKEWEKAHPEQAKQLHAIARRLRRARAKDSGGTHTAADLKEILEAQGHRCAYCRADLRRAPKHVDHIVPLVRGGSNGRANLQYLCAPCNQAKNAKDPVAYAQSIGLLL